MDVLAGYQNKAFAPLDEIASMLGFPGKMGMHGGRVSEEYLAGNIKDIRNYCETDVLNTYLVYLRWQHHRGVLSTEALNKALADVISLVEAEGEARPHLRRFIEAWGEASGNKFLMD